MLIDTHCHLNFQAFNNNLDEVIDRAKTEGIEKIIIPGAKIDSSEKGIEIANKYKSIYAAVGVHPHHVEEVLKYQGIKVLKYKLEELVKNKKVVAIGEIGLDYYEFKKTEVEKYEITEEVKKAQEELFRMQIEVAIRMNLPIIFHCRDAFDDTLKIITSYSLDRLSGVFHCFGGNENDLKKVLQMGFYVGFDGNITYKNADNLRTLVKLTPKDRLLVETDAPFLAPEPHRGERNEPKNVRIVLRWIAQVKGINDVEIAKTTTQNANKLFSI